ncbi:MAG: polysaccharide pyruvyl transferase family protein [Acidimicrobiales bacterium]
MRIVLANAWHDDNKGDGAIALATVDMLRRRYPGAELRVSSLLHPSDPAFPTAYRHLRLLFPDTVVTASPCPPLRTERGLRQIGAAVRWAGGIARAYARGVIRRGALPGCLDGADLVVMQGGSNVFDSGRGVVLGFLRLAQVLYPAWAASRAGVPTVFLGHTLGPFPPGPARWLVRRVLRRSRSVVVREPRSHHLAERLGVPADVVRTAPDLAFAVTPDDSGLVEQILVGHGLRNRDFAVFAIRRHPYRGERERRALITTLARAARRLMDEGVVAQVVVVAHTVGPTPVEDDREISRHLAVEIGRAVPVVERDLTPPELAALYAHARVVVSVRLHGAVLALSAGTPAYAISYFTAKTSGVMDALGMGDQVASYDHLDEDELVARVRALVGPEAHARAAAAARGCREALDHVGTEVLAGARA